MLAIVDSSVFFFSIDDAQFLRMQKFNELVGSLLSAIIRYYFGSLFSTCMVLTGIIQRSGWHFACLGCDSDNLPPPLKKRDKFHRNIIILVGQGLMTLPI